MTFKLLSSIAIVSSLVAIAGWQSNSDQPSPTRSKALHGFAGNWAGTVSWKQAETNRRQSVRILVRITVRNDQGLEMTATYPDEPKRPADKAFWWATQRGNILIKEGSEMQSWEADGFRAFERKEAASFVVKRQVGKEWTRQTISVQSNKIMVMIDRGTNLDNLPAQNRITLERVK